MLRVTSKVYSKGFTLIELVVVITILGILSAFAVPRFLSLDKEARIAAVNGLAGSVRSAAALTHSLYLANGGTAVKMEGVATAIDMAANGYPAAALDGINATLQDSAGFDITVAGTFSKTTGGVAVANCNVVYANAGTTGTTPTVTPTTSGC